LRIAAGAAPRDPRHFGDDRWLETALMTVTNSASLDLAVTVAVGQFAAVADVAANLETIERLVATAAGRGAALAVFPEASMYAFNASGAELAAVARSHGRRFETEIQALAQRYAITLAVGLYSEGSGALSRNTFVVAGADGRSQGRYEKLHLYDAFHYRESDKNERAPLLENFGELCVFDVAGMRFGLLNCYDLRFPEMARALVDRGADVLLVGSGWVSGPLKEMHWETLLKARAIENTCFVAAACQPAPLSVGLSMIVDPSGLPIATVADAEGIAVAPLTAKRLAEVRQVLPCLQHRRYAVVQNLDRPDRPDTPTRTLNDAASEAAALEEAQ
jgi:predicted amidohydrolase